ncbi:MAG: DUF4276 family protein [Phycisphaerae bacterium]
MKRRPALAILAEDASDAEVLTHVVRRHLNDPQIPVKKKGYDGCSALCRKGARDIRAWQQRDISRFIICHDADCATPEPVRVKVQRAVMPTGLTGAACIVIPVHEIEAWMMADELAINTVIPSFEFRGHRNPESVPNPKEWLVRESRASNGKPLYSPATFNPPVARHLRLDVVAAKCASFKYLLDWLDVEFRHRR